MKVVGYDIGVRRWAFFRIIKPTTENHFNHFCLELGSFLIDSDRDELTMQLSPVYVAYPTCATARKEFIQDLQVLYSMNPLWQRANIYV